MPVDHMKGRPLAPTQEGDGDNKSGDAKPSRKRRGPPPETSMVSTNGIYYHREVLTRSMDGRKLDLITITSSNNLIHNKGERKSLTAILQKLIPAMAMLQEAVAEMVKEPIVLVTVQ